MSKTPKLRFKEFSGNWESKKFGTLIDKISGGGTPSRDNPDFYNGNIPWLTVKDLKDLKYINTASEFITELGLKNSSAKLANENDLIIPTRMAVGRILIAKDTIAINQDLKVVSLKNDYSTEFIYYRYLNKSSFIEKLGVGSTVSGISMDDLYNIKFFIPSYEEQEKIASFFSLIDDKISLQGEKLDMLKDYKKGMMQKIFSRELRFKDDEGRDYPEWEEKKLGDISTIVGGGTPSTSEEQYWNGEIQWFTPSEINGQKFVSKSERTITDEGVRRSSAKLLPKGTILLTTRASLGDMAIAENEVTTNQGFQSIVVNDNINNQFIYYLQDKIKKYCYKNASGSTFLEISKKHIENLKVDIPCREEQNKIVNILSSIDLKIDKEQEKLDSLNEYKKGLLQQMFV